MPPDMHHLGPSAREGAQGPEGARGEHHVRQEDQSREALESATGARCPVQEEGAGDDARGGSCRQRRLRVAEKSDRDGRHARGADRDRAIPLVGRGEHRRPERCEPHR